MKQLLRILFLTAATLLSAHAGGEGWLIDFEAAKRKAAAEKKDLLVDFTGSDWCGYCMQLAEEVFQQESFAKGVADKFVLVEIDFPNDATKLSEETRKQNKMLGERYQIQGYPTIILMDSSGRPYARTGYRPGGAEYYLNHLNELREVRKKRDRYFAKAEKVEGLPKAEVLHQAVIDLDSEDLKTFYGDVFKEIVANDSEDKTGFQAAMAYQEAYASYGQKVDSLLHAGKYDAAIEATDAFLSKHQLTGFDKQSVLMTKVMAYVEQGKGAMALKELDELKVLAPESRIGQQVEEMKASVMTFLKQNEQEEEGARTSS